MENITYAYRVMHVGDRTMEVEYTAEGHQTLLVGVPLPLEGQDVDELIRSYSPVGYWLDQKKPRATVVPGFTGVGEARGPDPESSHTLADLAPVSHAQMIAALVMTEIITHTEGVEWIKGNLPAPVQMMINALPEDQRIVAELRAIRPTAVIPTDPLVAALATAQGKTEEDLINLFSLAANL